MTLKREWVFAWAALRLPLLGLVLYLFRYQLVGIFEGMIGFLGRMDFFVFTISTFSTRFLIYLLFVILLGFWYWLTEKLKVSAGIQYFGWLAGAFIGIYLSFILLFLASDALLRTTAVIAILAINTLPYERLVKFLTSGGVINLFFLAGIGVVETLFPQSYTLWLMHLAQAGNQIKKWAWLSGVFIAPLLLIFLLVPYDSQRVFTLAERLHANPAVEKFAPGIYNWVELNSEHNLLYVVGRGTNFMLAFDVMHLDQPPLRSREDIGKTQSFAFNPERQEIYIYEPETHQLVYMDALTLEVFKSILVSGLSPGDVWIRWLPFNDTIVLSSEADAEVGVPLYVFDRESGSITASMPFPVIPTAYLIFHPNKPLMYFNSFKDPYFAVWDMQNFEITRQVQITPRTDRMVFSEKDNEVWIASPLDGAVLRYDADTLEYAGRINTTFGDRTITLDTQRDLLLVGNFMNNRLVVIDLTTDKPAESFYLGPWIRTIALDVDNGVAYVSTVRGLFKVTYAQPLK